MSIGNYKTKLELAAAERKALDGVNEHFTKNVVLAGQSYSAKDIATVLNTAADLDDKASKARLQLSAASKAAADASDKAVKLLAAIKRYVVAHYGEDGAILSDFGFSARKQVQRTVDEKYLAVAKTRATRAARHTMGSRQRAAIHGAVVGAPSSSVTLQAPAVTDGAPVTNGVSSAAVLALNDNGSR